jgi:Glyoxalase-like domain
MLRGIDHLVIACPDVDAAAAELEAALGLRATGGGRHERLGTENRIVWLGDAYLELIGVVDPALAATSWVGVPTLRALETGGGLATLALVTDDVAAEVGRLREHGARLEEPIPGERRRPDGRVVRWQLAGPPRLGPDEPPFLIEHDPASAEWTPAERTERATEAHPAGGPVRLVALELPVEDVARVQGRYLQATALLFRPSLVGRGARDTSVGPHTIRLRPAVPGDRPTIRLELLGPGRPGTAELLGCRFVLAPGT